MTDKNNHPHSHKIIDKHTNTMINENNQTNSQTKVLKNDETENIKPISNTII